MTERDPREAAVKERMLAVSVRRIVLATGAAVGAVRMGEVCPIDDVDVLVAGESADPDVLEALRERGIEVVTA